MKAKVTKLAKPTCTHISKSTKSTTWSLLTTSMQLNFNLESENMKFGQETPKQMIIDTG
jgi:hypothetical protein